MHGTTIWDLEQNIFRKMKVIYCILRGIVKAYDLLGVFINQRGVYENWGAGLMYLKTTETEKCLQKRFRAQKEDLGVIENFADGIAVLAALRYFKKIAYLKAVPKQDYRLFVAPTLSSDELFFYSVAEMFCERFIAGSRPRYEYDIFALSSLRVNYTFNNVPAFDDTFNCGRRPRCMVLPSEWPQDKLDMAAEVL
uniref:Putative m13 family peptidase n=1 Tax=Ornithodoros turicata TaxID=34597 RepID=A0A2R5L7S5_9ACAR